MAYITPKEQTVTPNKEVFFEFIVENVPDDIVVDYFWSINGGPEVQASFKFYPDTDVLGEYTLTARAVVKYETPEEFTDTATLKVELLNFDTDLAIIPSEDTGKKGQYSLFSAIFSNIRPSTELRSRWYVDDVAQSTLGPVLRYAPDVDNATIRIKYIAQLTEFPYNPITLTAEATLFVLPLEESTLTIHDIPTVRYCTIGEKITIKPEVEYSPNAAKLIYQWHIFDGGGTPGGVDSSKYQQQELVIDSYTINDPGYYALAAKVEGDNIKPLIKQGNKVQLITRVSPTIYLEGVPNTFRQHKGGRAEFSADAFMVVGDINNLKIDWYYRGDYVGTGQTLDIPDVTNRFGEYRCVASTNHDMYLPTSVYADCYLVEAVPDKVIVNVAVPAVKSFDTNVPFELKLNYFGTIPESAGVTYQWVKDGFWIPNATGNTLQLTGQDSDEGEYHVICYAPDSAPLIGATVNSNVCRVRKNFLPEVELTVSPARRKVYTGTQAKFTSKLVTNIQSAYNIFYEWRKDGSDVVLSTTPVINMSITNEDLFGFYTLTTIIEGRGITTTTSTFQIEVQASSKFEPNFSFRPETTYHPMYLDPLIIDAEEKVEPPAPLSYQWYKDGNILGYTDAFYYDPQVIKDDDGIYFVKILAAATNMTLETEKSSPAYRVQMVKRAPDITVTLNKEYYAEPNTYIVISPTIITDVSGVMSYAWYHNGEIVSTVKDLLLYTDDIEKYGDYELHTTITGDLFETTTVVTKTKVVDKFVPPEPELDDCRRYIHDLNPAPFMFGGRDEGYIMVGWWVIDEIRKALSEGFDWMSDPENDRFRYKCELKTLVWGFGEWPDLEIQESRDGYILGRADLT